MFIYLYIIILQRVKQFGKDSEIELLTLVVNFWLKLDTCLHDINRAEGTVGKGAADTTSKGTLKVVCGVVHLRARLQQRVRYRKAEI